MASSMRLLIAATAVAHVGCILLVDGSPTGDQFSTTCGVADEASACGSCMTQSCASQLTACCADADCRKVLSAIDTCADAGTCLVDTTNAAAAALVKCVDGCSACNAEPATPFDGGLPIACYLDAPYSCNCSAGSSQNATRCDLTTVPNAICCADIGYPKDPNTYCACATIKCESYSTGDCTCSTVSSGNATQCNSAWGTCCANDGFCDCSPSSTGCSSFTIAVNDCNLRASVGCSSSQRPVNNCSPTAN